VKAKKRTLMQEKPGVSFQNMMQMVADTWKALPPEERTEFDRLASMDKARHDRQMIEFNQYLENNKGSIHLIP
jgi:TRAP-type C4-dicarboxylate transport system substrate-binding protein